MAWMSIYILLFYFDVIIYRCPNPDVDLVNLYNLYYQKEHQITNSIYKYRFIAIKHHIVGIRRLKDRSFPMGFSLQLNISILKQSIDGSE